MKLEACRWCLQKVGVLCTGALVFFIGLDTGLSAVPGTVGRRGSQALAIAANSVATASVNTPPAGPFHGCSPENAGGDVALNGLKSRVQQPSDPIGITVERFLAFESPSILTGLVREKWSAEDLRLAAAHETGGVVVEGYVVAAEMRNRQAWNCNSPRWHDLRLWIASSPQSPRSSAIAALAAPAWQEANPTWNWQSFEELASKLAHVRITGFPLYDDDEAVDLTRGRATLWEIHPITKIEVLDADGWREQLN